MIYNIDGGPGFANGWGVDTMTITSNASVPEPGLRMPVLGAAGVAAAFFGRRRFAR